jgi:hypothetical protein
MRNFDFYEFAGILVPGVIVLTGISLLVETVQRLFQPDTMSVGGLGLFLILAYAAGHLVQGAGNVIETGWWSLFGGMPTDWVTKTNQRLLADEQLTLLELKVQELTRSNVSIKAADRRSWRSITRQIYAYVAGAGRSKRVDTFNGNYGLNRGVMASLLTLVVVTIAIHGLGAWRVEVGLFAVALVSLYRMHRFGRHYATELFVQYLNLPQQGGAAGDA